MCSHLSAEPLDADTTKKRSHLTAWPLDVDTTKKRSHLIDPEPLNRPLMSNTLSSGKNLSPISLHHHQEQQHSPQPSGSIAPGTTNNMSAADQMKLAIMKGLKDLDALETLLSDSVSYRETYESNRHEVLCSILKIDPMHPEVFVNAIAVRAGLAIGFESTSEWRAAMKSFLNEYHAARHNEIPIIEYRISAKLLNVYHRIVCHIEAQFAATALANLPTKGKHIEDATVLSNSEKRRIQRALYRYHLMCRPFKPDTRKGPTKDIWDQRTIIFPPSEMSRLYLEDFEPFEVEEIACIHQWMWSFYSEILQTHEDEFLPKDVSVDGMLPSLMIPFLLISQI